MLVITGQVDQLEDRYLGMVEAGGSNPPLSTFLFPVFDFNSLNELIFNKIGLEKIKSMRHNIE